jgi:uncharacterized protein YndB with AHSA1/START domain
MTVINTTKDEQALTMTLVADFDATPDEVWDVWADPRKLERWWGPPTYPASFPRHEFTPGGESRYFMTGPEGDKHFGWWRIERLDPPKRLEFANGLSGDDGEPVPGVPPMPGYVTFESVQDKTRMTAVIEFVDAKQMETMLGMGMLEGMSAAIGQIDDILEDVRA